jgi:hypothetical protein
MGFIMIAIEMMRKLGVPACVAEGRLLNEGYLFNQKSILPKERKKTNPSDWMKKEEAARILGVSLEDVFLLIRRNDLSVGIRRGDIYISRKSIEEYKKKLLPERVEIQETVRPKHVIIKTRPFEPPKSKFRYINLIEYSPGQSGYEINSVAVVLRKDISFVQRLINEHLIEAVDIGSNRYIPRKSLRDFLKRVEAEKHRT